MKRIDLLAGLVTLIVTVGMGYVVYNVLNGSSPDTVASRSAQREATRSTNFSHTATSPPSTSSPRTADSSETTDSPETPVRTTAWAPSSDSDQAKPVLISATTESPRSTPPSTTPEVPHPSTEDHQPADTPPSLSDIHFYFDRAGFSDEARATLDRHAALLLQKPGWSVLIQGHTDQEGSIAGNLRVGRRRAESVRRYLIDKGVPADRLHIVSLGEFAPVCTEDTAECRERNRRVSFALAPEDIRQAGPHATSSQERAEHKESAQPATPPEPVLSSEEVLEEPIVSDDSRTVTQPTIGAGGLSFHPIDDHTPSTGSDTTVAQPDEDPDVRSVELKPEADSDKPALHGHTNAGLEEPTAP